MCKACQKIAATEWKQRNRDRINANQRIRRAKQANDTPLGQAAMGRVGG